MTNLAEKLKRSAPTILTILGGIGVVATAVFAAKAAPKAIHRKAQLEADKGEPLTVPETVKAEAPAYLPAIAVGAGTLACVFGANVLSRRQQASLASACAALESAYQGYRHAATGILGPGTDAMLEKASAQEKADAENGRPPWDETQTFYISGFGAPRFFERTMEQVMQAEYHLNRNFILRGSATLNEFLAFLDLEPTPEGDALCWDEYVGETLYGYRWIDFEHRYFTTDDGLSVCSVEMPFPPHLLEEDTMVLCDPVPAKNAAAGMESNGKED